MVAFIILHYKVIEETIECLDAIKKLDLQEKIKIVIVSNSEISVREKTKLLKYTKDIIINEENVGFARANNIGCIYAIEKYRPSYLVVINNDIIIKQKNFIELIDGIYKDFKYDILGPKIESPSNESVNPFPVLDSVGKIRKEIAKNEKVVKLYQNHLLMYLFKIYHNIKYLFIKKQVLQNGNEVKKNVALHGCALIFSKKYYQKYKDIFYNDTFLYHEEEFLFFRMKFDHLSTVYSPDIVVFHKEGASLDRMFDNRNIEKQLFKYRERNNSLTKLLDYINKTEKKR